MLEKVHGIVTFSPLNVGVAASFEREIEFMRVDGDFVTIIGLETLRARSDFSSEWLARRSGYTSFPTGSMCIDFSARPTQV
jgi:hypothetical protein